MNKYLWIDVQSLLWVLQKHWLLLSISWWCFREKQGVEKIPFQWTFSSTSDREKICMGLYCCVLVHKSLWNDLFWLNPMILRETFIKKNERAPLYYLKSLKTINTLQETAQHRYMHNQFCTYIVTENMPTILHYFFCLQTENSLWSPWQSSKILLLSSPCNSAPFPQPLNPHADQVWFVDEHWETLLSTKF